MQRVLVLLIFCATIAALPARASPLLSAADGPFGSSSLTYDHSTGLEWLDLTATLNKSYGYVSSELGVGGAFEGFRVAQRSELDQLFDDAGIQSPRFNPDVANLEPVTNLIDLVGVTQIDSLYGYRFACGIHGTGGYAGASGTGHSYGCLVASYGGQAITDVGTQDDRFPSQYIGAWLVRDHVAVVPEPTIALMMAGSLVVLGLWSHALQSHE